MNLDRFRDVADEMTCDLEMTPALRQRIIAALPSKRPVRFHPAVLTAAACLMVMAVSAGVLAMGNLSGWFDPKGEERLGGEGTPLAHYSSPQDQQLENRIVNLTCSADVEVMPMQEEETGLWGYVDEQGNWLVDPEYAEAEPVQGMCGRVTCEDGTKLLIMLVFQ